ncbi:MAG: hypothetical protein KatS3mg019_1077 [Fimbriimonadales bacterium]|nr:MAG: hypothetical protein KatS3mg019_1077 [Fimbriimonadales bacterium]
MNSPTSVKVLGTVGLLWGGIAVLILASVTVVFTFSPTALFDRVVAVVEEPLPQELLKALTDPVMRVVLTSLLLTQFGLYSALCWGSWHLLRLQETGRKWVLGCALAIALWEAGTPLIYQLVDQTIAQQYNITLPQRRQGFSLSLGMVYAGAAGYFLTRPTIRRAFK